MNGAVIRIDKNTGAAAPSNPNVSHPDADGKRIIAFGLRNPFRFTFHPTTGDIWLGDVGAKAYDEINRVADRRRRSRTSAGPATKGPTRRPATTTRTCPSARPCTRPPSTWRPFFSLQVRQKLFPADTCTHGRAAPPSRAWRSIPPAAATTPASYRGGMFFSDYSRGCIWSMDAGADGQPNTAPWPPSPPRPPASSICRSGPAAICSTSATRAARSGASASRRRPPSRPPTRPVARRR